MKKRFFPFWALAFFGGWNLARASVIGTSSSDVSNGMAGFLYSSFWHIWCVVFRWLADLFSSVLSLIYGYLSQALLTIPDFTSENFFTANQMGGADGHLAWQAILNLSHIFQYFGIFILVISFTTHIGKMALGLNAHSFSVITLLRLILPLCLIFAWPYIVSWVAGMATAFSFYIYHQCPNSTYSALSALTLSQDTVLGSSSTLGAGSYNPILNPSGVFKTGLGSLYSILFYISILFCILGALYGVSRLSSGKENGLKIIGTALVGFIIVFFTVQIVAWLGSPTGVAGLLESTQPLAVNQTVAVPGNGVGESIGDTYSTPPNAVVINGVNPGSSPLTPVPTPGPTSAYSAIPELSSLQPVLDPTVDNPANVLNSLLRLVISLWGVFIIISILIAKGFQLIMIFVLMFLGYPAIGLYGNPSTEGYPQVFWKLFLKYHLYCPMWALALVALNLIAAMNWSALTGNEIGVFATSFMVLGGLTLVQNSQDLAGLFSTEKGGMGGGASNFMKDAMNVVKTAGIAGQVLTAPIMQKVTGGAVGWMGASVGGALGTVSGLALHKGGYVEGLQYGSKIGSIVGRGASKAMNMVSNSLAGSAGKMIPGSGGEYELPERYSGIHGLGSHLRETFQSVAMAASLNPQKDTLAGSYTGGNRPPDPISSSFSPSSHDPEGGSPGMGPDFSGGSSHSTSFPHSIHSNLEDGEGGEPSGPMIQPTKPHSKEKGT